MSIENLQDELLAEILQRLLLPFLLRCKSVSKQFLRVISDPRFFHPLTHHQLLPPAFETHALFFLFHFRTSSNYDKVMAFSVDSNKKIHILKVSDFLPLTLPQDRVRVRVRATHYDLVLCSTQNNCYTHYFVCNPYTKQYVALPPISMNHAQELARVGFICDQSRSRFRILHIPINYFEHVSSFKVNMFLSDTGEWGAFNVTVPYPRTKILLSNSCSRNIIVYDDKFVWWMKDHGFFVCDPFNGWDSMWQIIPVQSPSAFLGESIKWDMYKGICNGRVKICAFSKTNFQCRVYELVNFEERTWSASLYHFEVRGVSFNDMNLLAFHPQYEYMIYFYSKKGIFLCDYKNQKLEPVYTTAADEDISVSDNVMSLVLPRWPTPVPTLKGMNREE